MLTLETVRNTIRNAFGRESFVASFIRAIHPDPGIPTAGINANGVLRYNPAFVEKYVKTPADLFTLITHELMHPMFGHFIYDSNHALEAIGADMVINSVITNLFGLESDQGELFKKFYPDHGLEGLLRPQSRMQQSRYVHLYNSFYTILLPKMSTGEAIHALKILTPGECKEVVRLIGSHGNSNGVKNGNNPALPRENISRIAADLQDLVKSRGKRPGFSMNLYDLIIEVLKTHICLKKSLLQRYLTRKKMDRFLAVDHRPGLATSPIPLHPSKRDMVLLAAGMYPMHYHQRVTKPIEKKMGLAIYLDVSGSVSEHLPKIIALLSNLKSQINSVFLFSNKVVEIPIQQLLAGKIHSTYGTDFNCIAESIVEKAFDSAVVITDGYADLNEENREALKEKRVRIMTILFGGKTDCEEFLPFGDVVQLDEVTE